MKQIFRILAVNPQVEKIEVALYENENCLMQKDLFLPPENQYDSLKDLKKLAIQQKDIILEELLNIGIQIQSIDAVVGRGGLLKPLQGGTYDVNKQMIQDLRNQLNGNHPANLGGLISYEIKKQLDIKAYIVDPVVVDELSSYAKITGLKEIKKRSIFHALSQKQAARKAATSLNTCYEDSTFIVVHIGGGISVGIHQNGKVVDVNNGLHGDGPFSPERVGTLPVYDVIDLCYSGKYTKNELLQKLTKRAGLNSYLSTGDLNLLYERVKKDDEKALFYLNVMAYQIAKEIGSLSTVAFGHIDAIVLTGRIQEEMPFIKQIMDRVKWIADVFVYPGENVLSSLAAGALRVLQNEEKPRSYK